MVRLHLQRAFTGIFSALLALSLVPAVTQAQESDAIVEDVPVVETLEAEALEEDALETEALEEEALETEAQETETPEAGTPEEGTQAEASEDAPAAELMQVDREVLIEAMAGADGLASQGDEGTLSFGTWAKGSIVKGKYYKVANGMYQYAYMYRFTLDEETQIKLDYSSTQYSSSLDELNKQISLLELWDGNGDAVWSSQNKLTTQNGKLTCSQYLTLPADDYIFWIKLAYFTNKTPYSGWFGSYQLKVSKAPFKDVLSENWFYGVVGEAVDQGLMSGYTGSKAGWFGSQDNLERGQVAVILWRMAGKPAAGSGAKTFSDVKSGDYYYNAVCWASANKIVNGYEGTDKFGPKDPVTREQLAIMMFKYAKNWCGLSAEGSADDYASMGDAASVADYAQSSLGWCFKNKILSGNNGNILPKDKATRAEAAKMLTKLNKILSA